MKKNLSPDPRTNSMSDETRAKLGEIIKECVTDLLKSGDAMPAELKRILIFAKKKLDRKWPPSADANSFLNVVVFLFSHVIIPATAQPHVWGIAKEPHTSESGRTSIVLNKVFRNIANGAPFDTTSPLSAFNITIKKLQPKIKDFLEAIMAEKFTTEEGGGTPPLRPADAQSAEVVNIAFQTLHHCLYLWKDAILEYRNSLTGVPVAEARIFFDVMGILEELELIDGKPECPSDFSPLSLDKSTKPPSKATMRRPTPNMSGGASSSAAGGNAKPYVRQLSEKWNREHQLMLVEAKKREQAAEQRKAARDERGREKSISVAPPVIKSTPSTPTKPKVDVPQEPASANAKSGRQGIQRSLTSDPPAKLDFTPTVTVSSATNGPESPVVDSPSTSEQSKHHLEVLAEKSEPSSPSSPTALGHNPDGDKSSAREDNNSQAEDAISASVANSVQSYSPLVSSASLSTRTSSRSLNSDTSFSSSANPDRDASLPSSDAESGSNSASASAASVRTKHRKSKKLSSAALIQDTTSASAGAGAPGAGATSNSSAAAASPVSVQDGISAAEVASPQTKRRKKVDGRSPSDAPTPAKLRRAKSKVKDDDAVDSASTPISSPNAATSNPTTRSPLRVHRETLTLDLGTALPGEDHSLGEHPSSPKLTIVSLKPNPSLNQLENTPVSPRAAEFLRERSNSVSSPSGQKQSKKAEKALEMLGLNGGGDSRSSASMAQVVRELGVANATLQKELEAANAKRDQLERDLARLQELHEARSARISEFHSKLTSSILYKRNKATHIRRLTMHAKRTFNASLDDNLFDLQSATLTDRRSVLASTIFARAQDTSMRAPGPVSSSSSSSLVSGSRTGSKQFAPQPLSSSGSKDRRDSLDSDSDSDDPNRSDSPKDNTLISAAISEIKSR